MSRMHYEDSHVGDRVVTPGRTVSETDVVMFASLSGDWNPVHTDKEYAAEHTPFGERIAHGLLGLVIGSSLISRLGWEALYPKSAICLTGMDRVRFRSPIKFGDTIHLEAEIIDKTLMPGGQNGLLTTRLRILNQRGELVITARTTMMVGRRPR